MHDGHTKTWFKVDKTKQNQSHPPPSHKNQNIQIFMGRRLSKTITIISLCDQSQMHKNASQALSALENVVRAVLNHVKSIPLTSTPLKCEYSDFYWKSDFERDHHNIIL